MSAIKRVYSDIKHLCDEGMDNVTIAEMLGLDELFVMEVVEEFAPYWESERYEEVEYA